MKIFPQVWEIAASMGISQDYVKKVCFNHHQKGPEYCVNYLFENPSDTGSLKEINKNK